MKDPRPMRTRSRRNLASPDNMLSKGKEDPQALVESQKNQVSQNRITRSRRKEEIISPEKQASQGSRSCEVENVSKTQDVQGPSRRIELISDAEEDVPLPGSSGARGEKTNSFKTLKSSHPTHKTVEKRRKHSVDSFAKFLALGRHSPEYNPFQNGQKIIVPSEDAGGSDAIITEVDVYLKAGRFSRFLRALFLPYGFPESVSDDYIPYQLWDTLQAFCSTLNGILTTEAVMKGVGVGNDLAIPLAATVTWILKDGVGMIAKITFAWWKGTFLDFDCKKWRFFADVINDCALSLELLLFYYSDYATLVLCISSTLKAIVGVAGGATRAAITQHQAVRGNMADVSAKDGSQETCVNLIASMLGLLFLTYVDTSRYLVPLFLVLTTIHIFANYQAVRSVVMKTLNTARYRELLNAFVNMDRVADPCYVNKQESVLLGRGLSDVAVCNYKIHMGATIQDVMSTQWFRGYELKALLELYQTKKYIVIEDYETNIIYVIIHKKADSSDVVQSYFHAVMIGKMATIFAKYRKEPPPSRIMDRLQREFIGNIITERAYELRNREQGLYMQTVVNNFVDGEFPKFKKIAESRGWNMTNHNLALDEWRAEW